ncbi:hypothetical protein [Imhoffiella purpurea]|uniref:Uncharacterized protein n=1 Tax=Imhoffiella purpurea TaxID=1249627 RepID=W9V3E4_9GAMM|nr:hypothetical protein [Imhoffiella purpurea]EXJ13824.1 hypothetical protein D779_3267 [Imhoffiella purpurea]
MLALLLGIIVGVIIGWNWPQPVWAKAIQSRFVNFVSSSAGKSDH